MAVTIIANGHLGTLKKQRVSTNTTNVPLSTILNNANIIPPVTNEPNKVFSYWATTISGFDIGDYTISQLYSIGAITKENVLNIYANFTYVANSIQVTFNANGGTFPDGSTSKVISTSMGSIYSELESSISVLPTKADSYFLKWTDPKNNIVNGSYEFTESVVIVAQYSSSQNSSVTVKDSRGKSVIAGLFPKSTLWRDLYAQAISNGYTPDDIKKVFSAIKPGYGSYTGQAIKSIDFSVANNPMKIGWLRGSIYEAAHADVSLYTNRNLLLGTEQFTGDPNRWAFDHTVDADPYNGHKAVQTSTTWGGPEYVINDLLSRKAVLANTDYILSVKIKNTSNQTIDIYFYAPAIGIMDRHIIKLSPNSDWTTISTTFQFSDIDPNIDHGTMRFEPSTGIPEGQGSIIQTEMKFEEGATATPYQPAPEDYPSKKIRDFSATTVPVDPSTTFSVTGKATNQISLTHNPIGPDEYWTNRNYFSPNKVTNAWVNSDGSTSPSWADYLTDYIPIKGKTIVIQLYESLYPTNTSMVLFDANKQATSNPLTGSGQSIFETLPDGTKGIKIIPSENDAFLRISFSDGPDGVKKKRISFYTDYSDWSPAMEDTKPGLWLNDNWLYNPYTQKWLDTPIDNTDYSYANSVITFKNYFNVQYVTGDISKVRSSVTATVKSVVAGYGSTTDKKALYDNSYFPSDDSGVTLNVEEYLGYSYIVFYNPSTGYSQKVYQQAGTPYSEFLKGITRSRFEAEGKYLKGFYVSNYWTNAKLIASNPINSPIDMAKSDYLLQPISLFVTVFFNANGGVFYKGTSYETQRVSIDVSKMDTYGIVVNYLPDISKRTMGLLYWVMDLDVMEPAYPLEVQNGKTLYPKWSIVDRVELYRKPREYYLIDLKSIYNGWDMMDKFSISDKNNIFVIDPTGTGSSYSETNSKSNSNGWSKYDRSMSTNAIEFDAYYKGYEQYNRLGRWIRGKELVLAMLNETGVPTYWTVEINEIERTEIKHGTDILTGKLSFNKTSPAFDLEFIGLGTDNTIDNADDMFRKNAYVYIHSLQVPDTDNGIQIIATDGKTTIEDSVEIDLPAGSYFEYSTLPFREAWKYGPGWKDLPNNLYNNIIDLVGARPIRVGIGKWDISVSSSNKVTINSLAPHKIQDYAGKTIDSLGGLGPFTGIAIKEKEL